MKTVSNWVLTLTILIFSCALIVPATATAQSWNFDTCDSTEITEVELTPPAAMFMLDRSGSMGWNSGAGYYCCWDECSTFFVLGACVWPGKRTTHCGHNASECGSPTYWQIATSSIKTAVGALENEIEFGIGFYPSTTIAREATLNAAGPIANLLDNTGPSGGTPTHTAISYIRNSNTMNRTDQATAGVLITDGAPNSPSAAVTEACAMRDAGQTLYVVGLGGGTDTAFNNKLAAAGGTGSCTGGDPCSNPSVSKSSCSGSIQANNQTQFQAALSGITDELACTFPVDTSLYPAGGAPSDPMALRVRIEGAQNKTLLHRDYSGNNEGWYYPNLNNLSQIALTDEYCGMVADKEIEVVETTMACPCVQTEGTACEVENPPLGICPEGTWTCNSGYDFCEPISPQLCPVPCPGWPLGAACHVDNPVNEHLTGPNNLATERNRCKIGELQCENNYQPVCVQVHQPMPELCNGLDNDCDGIVGNISESWAKPEFSSMSVPAGHQFPGAACYEDDICRCDGARGEHGGVGPSPNSEFQDYLDNFSPVCECAEG